MKVIWNSCKGQDRRYNSDYGIFCNYPGRYIFIIGDAREESESDNFIKYILEFIAKQFQKQFHLKNPNEILDILKSARETYVEQEGIPKKLPNQMASLHILIVDKKNLQTQSFNLGDCRFGRKIDDKWEWLTEFHVIPGREHYVTQSFRTKKPIGEIDQQEFHLEKEGEYCLGSDGYWKGNINQYDDSSQLLVSELGTRIVEIKFEEINFSIFIFDTDTDTD